MSQGTLVGLEGTGNALAEREVTPAHWVIGAIYVAATATGAYHGYKRNDSVGWALAWGLAAGLFPYIALPIAVARGFGEEKQP